ncbi:vascular cell adhesion protein 1-like [Leucoraja erinacea]|uniref:vascular cell adhesion protein 1-like n=1 Tax=Leucoraja erinaceus TaxID=7782 RepID=UPI0024557A4A|nr:vascular cell adhesion protein 1-like [Leucoraja erinacea]
MAGDRCDPAATITLALMLATGSAFNLELNPSRNVWARIGDSLELNCEAKNCSSPTFTWRIGTDNPLGGTITTRGSVSTFTISAVTTQNQHKYTCSAKCGTEEKTNICQPQYILEQFSFCFLCVAALSDTLIVETVGSLEVGQRGSVRCTVPKVYPAQVEVEWLKGTTLVKTDSFRDYTEEETAMNFIYELTPELRDSGQELTCRVQLLTENQPRKAEGSLTLQVHYAPTGIDITAEPSATVREGQDVRLTCAADSSPAATIVWSKLSAGNWSVVAEDRAILHLSPALFGDTGMYRCEAGNKLGTITKEVEFHVQGSPRDTTLSITPSAVKGGDRVTFSCTTQSNRPAHLVLRRQSASGWSELDYANGTLTIRDVKPADAGLYQCEAINALGKQINITKLQVQGSPRDTTLSDVKEGDRVTFNCTTQQINSNKLQVQCSISDGAAMAASPTVSPFVFFLLFLLLFKNLCKLELTSHGDYYIWREKVTIGCTIHNIPSANFTWKKVVNNSENVLSFSNNSFTILEKYTSFRSTVGDSELDANELSLTSPDVGVVQGSAFNLELNPSRNVWARIGDSLELNCEAKSCSSPTFTWRIGTDNPLGGTITTRGSVSKFTISAVTTQNQHKYTCSAKCGTEEKRKYANLNIFSLSDTLIVETVGSLEVGQRGSVRCTVPKVYPAQVEVEWLKGTTLLKTDSFRDYTEEETAMNFTYELTAELRDSGQELTCRVQLLTENQPRKAEGSLTLQVHYAPTGIDITAEPSATVREGQDVRLTCAADSSPAATIVWSKLSAGNWSVVAEDRAILHLSPALFGDTGMYRCEAGNKLGTITKEVEFHVQGSPRDTTLSITPSAVKEGDRVTFSCTTQSNPSAHLVLKRQSSSGWSELDSENGTLTIRDVQPADAGLYQCEATNALGKQINITKLQVQGSPRDTTLSITPSAVKEGDRVTFSCTTQSNPPAHLVLRRQSSSGWSKLDSENGTLTIRDVQPADAGLYQCEATNALGKQINITKLQVQEKIPDIATPAENPAGVLEAVCIGAALVSAGLICSALFYAFRRSNLIKSYKIAGEIL